MPVHLVSEADIKAISIVGKGANRKRFFLTKAKGDAAKALPSVARIVKASDWSACYCVVAEPGWHESPGSAPGTDQAVEDRWASEDEIRKAAHRFMANGGLVNKMHESLEPFGQLVENAVALADFTVDGETIRKGSWDIAIEPTTEGKEAIDKGEFTGVSIEGLAVRELVEKGGNNPHDNPPEPFSTSTTSNWVARAGGLPPYIQHVAHALVGSGHTESEAISTAVGIVRNWAEGKGVGKPVQAAAAKALAEWEAKKAKAKVSKTGDEEAEAAAWLATLDDSAPSVPTVTPVEKTLLQKIAEAVGLKAEDIEKAELTPAQQKVYDKLKAEGKSEKQALALASKITKAETFGELIAARELEDALPDALCVFREAVNYAFFPPPGESPDVNALISQSCDEFKTWALGMLEQVPVEKAERAEHLGVELTPDGSVNDSRTKDGDMALTDAENARIEKLETAVADLPGQVTAALAKALGGTTAEDADPTPESIAKAVKDLASADESEHAERLAKIEADIEKLAEGDSSQTEDGIEPVSKSDKAAAVAKAYESEGLSPNLAGVI